MKIIVNNILKSPFAAYHNEGLLIYQLIEQELKNMKPVELSFEGVETCSSMFLNACIGKLYLNFPPAQIESLLKYTGTKELKTFNAKLDDVIQNALNSEFHDKLVDEAIHA